MSLRTVARRITTTSAVTVLASGALVAVAGNAAPTMTAGLATSAATDTCTTTSWGGTHGWSGLAINGDAAVVGSAPNGVLRVTPDVPAKAGSAFSTNKIALTDNLSFSTHFVFQFLQPIEGERGADGLVFVIQPNSNSVGTGGQGIGFSGIDNSLGVEIDDFDNGAVTADKSAADIGIDLNGDPSSVLAVPMFQYAPDPVSNFDDGAIRQLWIDYDSTTSLLEVRFAENGSPRPTDPVISYQLNLAATIGTTDAFVGFTSATGQFHANHDVLSWEFSNCYAPNGTSQTCTSTTSWGGAHGWAHTTAFDDAELIGDTPNAIARLTPDEADKTGGFFTFGAIPLSDDGSFSTHFVSLFTKSAGSDGADGITFVVKPTLFSLGNGGAGLGYDGISNSFAVELDDFKNTGDVSDSALGLDVDGSTASLTQFDLSTLTPPVDLDDGTPYQFWVDYDGSTHIIEVRMAGDGSPRPTDALISYQEDLSTHLGTNSVVVGFTGATSSASAIHDILSWEFANCYSPFSGGDGGGDGGGGGENTPPTVDAGDGGSGHEGSQIFLDATVSDPDAGDSAFPTWEWAWDASSPAASKATGTCAFSSVHAIDTNIACTDNGLVNVKLTADDGTDESSDTAQVTVTNVAPDVGLTAPDEGTTYDVGATVPLAVSLSDAGINDTFTCTVDWGDGAVDGPTANGCISGHAYAAEDVYSVAVTVTDDDGDSGHASVDVDVEAADDGGGGGSDRAEVTGGGEIRILDKHNNFSVHADVDKKGRQHGHLDLHTYDKHHFNGHVVTGLTVNGSTASWAGTGTWDHKKGYSYTVTVIDGGEGKLKTPDHIEIYIRDPNGLVVFMLTGNLSGGNIKVHPKH